MLRRVGNEPDPGAAVLRRDLLLLVQPGQVGGRPHIGRAVRRRLLLRDVKTVPVLGPSCDMLGGRSL